MRRSPIERVVCFLGRSMQNSVRAARELGILRVDDRGRDRHRGGRRASTPVGW